MENKTSEIEQPLLWEEYPITVCRKLARRLGLESSIVVQEIHYLLDKNGRPPFRDGRYWVKNSRKEWRDFFSFLHPDRVDVIIEYFIEAGLFIYEEGDWYSIDYEHELIREAGL